MLKFFECLSLCHTVQLDLTADVKFQASSPDEFSFVKFCEKYLYIILHYIFKLIFFFFKINRVGIIFEGDLKSSTSNPVRMVNFFGDQKKYELLHVLEFDSTRKRMSVILRSQQTNKLIVFCKGAEDSIFSICSKNGKNNITECNQIINEFARNGWRTLALAYRYLNEEDYSNYDTLLNDAYNDLTNQEVKLKEVFEKIENNLELIGATAVEDRLQEDVASTLESLRQAGIKIWVLTGDKRETAINISNSCKHFANDMIKLISTDLDTFDDIKSRLKQQQKQ